MTLLQRLSIGISMFCIGSMILKVNSPIGEFVRKTPIELIFVVLCLSIAALIISPSKGE